MHPPHRRAASKALQSKMDGSVRTISSYFHCSRSAILLLAFSVSLTAQTRTVQLGGETARSHASGAAESLDIFGPGVIAVDPYGSGYVAVRDGIFKVDTGGARARIAGLERKWRYAGDGAPAIRTGINPRGMAVDRAGNLFFA